jgi:integral membrane sensor domain MASE1
MTADAEPRDALLWPIDRTCLLGFAPAGLAAAGTLLAARLLDGADPARIVSLVLLGNAAVWLLFAPIYLLGWVHNHPRRDRSATGWTGSLALTVLMYLLNVLMFGLLVWLYGADVRWGMSF